MALEPLLYPLTSDDVLYAILLPDMFRVQGSGFRVQGSGFRVQGSGFRAHDLGFMIQGSVSEFRGFGLGLGVLGLVF